MFFLYVVVRISLVKWLALQRRIACWFFSICTVCAACMLIVSCNQWGRRRSNFVYYQCKRNAIFLNLFWKKPFFVAGMWFGDFIVKNWNHLSQSFSWDYHGVHTKHVVFWLPSSSRVESWLWNMQMSCFIKKFNDSSKSSLQGTLRTHQN